MEPAAHRQAAHRKPAMCRGICRHVGVRRDLCFQPLTAGPLGGEGGLLRFERRGDFIARGGDLGLARLRRGELVL